MKRLQERQSGAVLVEVAIGFPVFIAFFLFFLWYGYSSLARRTLKSAVRNGVSAARTRGNPELSGYSGGLIPLIDEFQTGNIEWEDVSTNSAGLTVKDLFVYSDDSDHIADSKDTYDDWVSKAYGDYGKTLKEMPLEYLYALFYTQEAMREAFGEHLVRFPCDPSKERSCLKCIPMNALWLGCLNSAGIWSAEAACACSNPAANGSCDPDDIPTERFGIRCTYSLAGGFMSTAIKLVTGGSSTEPVKITSSAWYDMNADR